MSDRRQTKPAYSARELDHYFEDFRESIKEIKETVNNMEGENKKSHANLDTNQKKTNGNVLFHTKILLVFGAVLATLLITNGSQLIQVFKLLI